MDNNSARDISSALIAIASKIEESTTPHFIKLTSTDGNLLVDSKQIITIVDMKQSENDLTGTRMIRLKDGQTFEISEAMDTIKLKLAGVIK